MRTAQYDDKDGCRKKRQTVHLKFVMYQAITFLTRNIYHGTTNHVVFKEREQQKMKYGCKKLCHTIFDDESTKKNGKNIYLKEIKPKILN